ncbi:ferredoxin [Rugosimonospora acidiphila]|uniref:Ferredoxin n=1 Tax=Rugosimonospora acidiphila TaxID=556531 RepID=A0ABP9S2V1_9ACTN
MHIVLDPDLCQAYGNCLLAAPDVFELTEATPVVIVRQANPGEDLRAEVEEAVRSCPVQALTLEHA